MWNLKKLSVHLKNDDDKNNDDDDNMVRALIEGMQTGFSIIEGLI